MDVTLRWCTDDDLGALAEADGRAFGFQITPSDLEDRRRIMDLRRFLAAEEDGRVVGLTGDYPFMMTVPGGRSIDVRGVTWVSVQPTHRRRGILTLMMAEQHRRLVESGAAMAILTASEGGIYGRFGYGPASFLRRTEIDRRTARLRSNLPTGAPVRFVGPDEARTILPDLLERWRAGSPGGLSRSENWWEFFFLDRPDWRDGASGRFYVVHPDGYVAYRVREQWDDGRPASSVEIVDLFTAAEAARVELWRFLLGLDLVGPIRSWSLTLDDPLSFLLDDPRQVRTLALNDGLWVRILDVPAALAARTYQVPGEVVLDVHDTFLGRGGSFRLRGGPDGATCEPCTEAPDLELDVSTLGSLYLGGHRALTLGRAGLVVEHTLGALARADAMFGAERQPRHGTGF